MKAPILHLIVNLLLALVFLFIGGSFFYFIGALLIIEGIGFYAYCNRKQARSDPSTTERLEYENQNAG